MSQRWFAPSPTVRVARTPLRELGAVLGSLGDCCSCDFSGFYCDGFVSCDKQQQPYGPSEYGCGMMGPPINPCAIAIGDTILGTNEEVPGTGQTVGELESIGYSQAEIASIMDYPVPGTGQTVNELLADGYSAAQINSMLTGQGGQTVPGGSPQPGRTSSGGSSGGGGSSAGSGGKGSGGSSLGPKPPQTPIVPRPSPTVSNPGAFGSNPLGFLTQASLIAGIPNWIILGGGILLATSVGSSGGGRKR